MKPRVTTESRASIGSLSLLGEPVIDISPSATGHAAQGRRLHPARTRAGADCRRRRERERGLDQVTGLLKDIRAGKGTVGKLFTDEQLYREIDAFVASAQVVTGICQRGKGTLGMLLSDPASYRQAERRARQPGGDDPTDQRRRGQPRPAAEGRRAGEIADVGVRQRRSDHGRLNRGEARPASC